MAKKNILIIGSGGREHALAWKVAQSPLLGKLYVSPGNPGTASLVENIAIPVNDIPALAAFAQSHDIHLTIVGPDNTLAEGIVDYFQEKGLAIFGPTKHAAEIEWSKAYAKNLMQKYRIPTAQYAVFSSYSQALTYLKQQVFPVVVKADGLALGKGVFICSTLKEGTAALKTLIQDNLLGEAGNRVVIEEYLEGREVSAHAICSGTDFILFHLAQDHKRIGEGNTGPNTGGMGTICPVPEDFSLVAEIVTKTLQALKQEGRPFTGCLFPGLMLTKDGPKVLEFNARFGDPETQVYMRLLKTDLLEALLAASEGTLGKAQLIWEPGAAACVVLASAGYPGSSTKGKVISGLESIAAPTVVFQAGTAINDDQLVTAGGRVLNVTSTGKTLQEALQNAYNANEQITFPGKQFRRDIGFQYVT